MKRHFLLLFSMATICAVQLCFAQQQLGSISGTVTDSTGAMVAKATVKVQNTATNLIVTEKTQKNGYYIVPDLPIGTYIVTISQAGFRSESHSDVIVEANRTTTVSAALKIGAVEETVEVKGTSLVNQTDPTIGYVLNESTINDTPLGTGSFTQLAILSPGVNADLLAGSGTNTGLGNQSIWANGQRDSSNSFSLNGVTADNLFSGKSASQVADTRFTQNTGQQFLPDGGVQTNMSVYNSTGQGLPTPAPESLQELRVNTAMYDASQGANSGAHIGLTTKSGSNSFHGQVYEYRQSDAWNAAPWFRNNNPTITPKVPKLHNNRFGGTFGGPIVKDRVFFFASYQGVRIADQLQGTSTLTVPLHLTDDRSAAALAGVANTDFCTPKCPNINPAQIDPAAVKLFQFKLPNGQFLIPSPTTTNAAIAKQQGYDVLLNAPASAFTDDQFNANLDYNISQKDRLSAKYFYSNNPTSSPFSASNLLGFPQSNQAGSYVASVNNTTILTPMLTWNQTVGIARQNSFVKTGQPLTPADVGINLFGLTRFPAIVCFTCDGTIRRGVTFGPKGNFANAGFFQNQLQTSSNLTWAHGAHTISTGFNLDLAQLNVINRNNQVATLDANDFPSLLLGQFNPGFSSFFNGATSRYYRAKQVGGYVQDAFKVRPNLTLDLGLRYDWDGPLTEKFGNLANFDGSRYQYNAASDTIVDSGIVVAGNNKTIGTPGVSDSTLKGRQWGFGPRIGFAWSPGFAKNLVVRGGFGIYYDRGEFFSELSPGSGRGFNGPFGVTLALPFVTQLAPTGNLSNPFGTTPPAPPTNAQAITQLLPNASAISSCNSSNPRFPNCTGGSTYLFGGYDVNNMLPYTENWSFDLQWQPLNNWVVTLGYVGNRGLHEVLPIPFNQAGIATPQNPIHGQTSSYGFNIVPSENIKTVDGGNTDLRVPFLGYSTNSVLYRTNGISSYNALQTGVQKRFSYGLQLTASYTWSHVLDEQSDLGLFFNGNNPLDPRSSYATATFDRTHVFVISYLYELPKPAREGSLLGKFANGWGLSGTAVAESGQPYNIADFSGAVAGLYYGNTVSIIDPILPLAPGVSPRSALIPGNPVTNPNGGLNVIDPTKFAIPFITSGQNGVPLGDNMETAFSSGGRNIFRAPFQTRFDMALRKQTRLTERLGLKYELDAFNVFNHPSFAAPRNTTSLYNSSVTSANVTIPVTSTNAGSMGIIQNTIGSPRFLQMSVHLTF